MQWHKARLNDDSQVAVETIAAPVIENSLHALSELETLRLKNAELQARLELIDSKAAPTYPLNEIVRLGFYVGKKRTVIALSGFYLNALMMATGIDKKAIPAWINSSVSGFEGFNTALNVTEQVKLLIVRELESELIKARVV